MTGSAKNGATLTLSKNQPMSTQNSTSNQVLVGNKKYILVDKAIGQRSDHAQLMQIPLSTPMVGTSNHRR